MEGWIDGNDEYVFFCFDMPNMTDDELPRLANREIMQISRSHDIQVGVSSPIQLPT